MTAEAKHARDEQLIASMAVVLTSTTFRIGDQGLWVERLATADAPSFRISGLDTAGQVMIDEHFNEARDAICHFLDLHDHI